MGYYCPYCDARLKFEKDEEVWSCITTECGKFHGRIGMVYIKEERERDKEVFNGSFFKGNRLLSTHGGLEPGQEE